MYGLEENIDDDKDHAMDQKEDDSVLTNPSVRFPDDYKALSISINNAQPHTSYLRPTHFLVNSNEFLFTKAQQLQVTLYLKTLLCPNSTLKCEKH